MSEKIAGEAGEYFQDWLDNNLDPDTAYQYRHYLNMFLDWLDMDTQVLYERHRDSLKSDEPIRRMWLSKKVTGFMKIMRDELGYSTEDERGNIYATGTVSQIPKTVTALFKSIGIEEIPGDMNIPTLIDEIPKAAPEQLRRMVGASGSYKTKAYIMFAKDSGLRTGDITNLPLGVKGSAMTKDGRVFETTLKGAIADSDVEFFTFQWRQNKTKRLADPVIGPETMEALREWMRYRTERLSISANDSDPTFCIERTKPGYTRKNGKEIRGTAAGGWMNESNMGTAFRQLRDKAGLTDISVHSCRKLHKTNLEAAGIPTSWVNKMQGRKGQGTGGVYTKPDPRQLLKMYKSGYEGLRVFERGQISEVERRRQQFRDMVNMMFADDEDKRSLALSWISQTMTHEQLDTIPRKIRELTERIQNKNDVLIVDESELGNHLNHGWEYVGATPSGKCIVRRTK